MKKLLFVFTLLFLFSFGVYAQDFSYAEFEESFSDFADGVAASLPFNTTVGLNWSDAYIGQFPHFGVGLTLGVTTIPYSALDPVFDLVGADLGSNEYLEKIGAPIPAYTLDARLGGFILPFDVGFKIGFIPEAVKEKLPLNMDYLLVGADVRVPVLKGSGIIPKLAVGGGFNYLRGDILIEELVEGEVMDISDMLGNPPGTDLLTLSDPDVNFNWQANVIDLKAQASWKLLILRPNVGVGVAYGKSKAGGGLITDDIVYNKGSVESLKPYFEAAGVPFPTAEGILVSSEDVGGWSVRAFGGLGISLLILKIDLTGMYNFTSGSIGAAINARIQF